MFFRFLRVKARQDRCTNGEKRQKTQIPLSEGSRSIQDVRHDQRAQPGRAFVADFIKRKVFRLVAGRHVFCENAARKRLFRARYKTKSNRAYRKMGLSRALKDEREIRAKLEKELDAAHERIELLN